MPFNQRINKENVIYLHNGLLLSYKNNIMKFVGKRMELGKIIPNEVTQIQKDKQGMYSLISGYYM